jgi:hypothetical protein
MQDTPGAAATPRAGPVRALLARTGPYLILAAATVYAAAALLLGPSWTVDDAFIVARYADNLTNHGQLTWNVDAPPVEGFTGLVLPAVMALAMLLQLSPIHAAVAVAVVAFFGGAALVYACHRPLGVSRLAGALAAAVYLTAGEQFLHVLSGLETELFIALTVGCAWSSLRGLDHPAPPRALPAFAAACALTRPEGVLVGSVFLVGTTLARRERSRAWWIAILVWFGLPLALWQASRLAHFGAWLPNTYYAKLSLTGLNWDFGAALREHLLSYFGTALATAVGVAVVARATGARGSLDGDHRAPMALLVGGCGVILLVAGIAYTRNQLMMNYAHRFVFHFFGLLVLLLQLLAGDTHRRAKSLVTHRRPLGLLVTGIAVLGFASSVVHGIRKLETCREFQVEYQTTMQTQHVPIARWLSERLPPDAVIACYPDAGIIPYLTRLRTVDFGRLNDAYLARSARSEQDVVDYFFRVRPNALVMTHVGGLAHGFDAAANQLLRDPRFGEYRQVSYRHAKGAGVALYTRE